MTKCKCKCKLLLIATAKGSNARMNSIGDKGHPCRVPLYILKGFDIILLVLTSAIGLKYKILTQHRNESPKPKRAIISFI